jgi:predicted Mrr-cat superfamily restriction endonuclease
MNHPNIFTENYPHIRRVKWLRQINRDDLSLSLNNSFHSNLAVYQLNKHLIEIHKLASKNEGAALSNNQKTRPQKKDLQYWVSVATIAGVFIPTFRT